MGGVEVEVEEVEVEVRAKHVGRLVNINKI